MDHERMTRLFAAAARLRQQGTARRAGLSESLQATLQASLRGLPRNLPRTPAAVPRPVSLPSWPGRFLERRYANAAGERTFKLYVPSRRAREAVPLVVMLHGGTQSGDDFAIGTRMNELAEYHGFLVAYPEQSRGANPMAYWNWWKPEDQQRGRGEASLIAGLTQHLLADNTADLVEGHTIDSRRVYVAGLSAGGAMAAVMASAYPDVYAAAGIHSGLPAGAAHDLPSAYAAMAKGAPVRPGTSAPLIIFHGDEDRIVASVNADGLARAALPAGAPGPRVTTAQVQGGHSYTRRVYLDGDQRPQVEQWLIHQAGHAWSGGSPDGTYTDPQGPNASAEMIRFFSLHAQRASRRRAA